MSVITLGETSRKAHSEHKCYWCRELILVRSTYYEWRGVEDGRAYTLRMHMQCLRAHQDAEDYNNPINDEPACWNTDIDGGGHEYGQRCPECSDLALGV